MADENQNEQATPEGEVQAEEVQPKKKSNKFKLILLLLVVLLIAGGVGGYIFYQKQKEKEAHEKAAKEQSESKESIFHDLDEIIVNLNTEGKGVSFMKLKITVELESKKDFDVLMKMLPRVMDVFQVYMRELRPSDMQGSIGIYRLREELLLRINKILYPSKVKDILFKEVLVQ
jgi:flagellar protein FliL